MTRESSNIIGVFSLAFAPFVGGAEIALQEIIKRSPKYRFICFTCRFDASVPREESYDNIQIFRVGHGQGFYKGTFQKAQYIWYAWRRAEKAHKKDPFIAIWAMMASYAGMAALLFKIRHPHVPFLLTLQEGESEAYILKRVRYFYPLWKIIFKRADRIQVISRHLKEFAIRHGATCPIDIIPNGVDVKKFSTRDGSVLGGKVKSLRLKGYDRENPFTIITTSRLVYKNGIDILIHACAQLPITNYVLRIVGQGPDEGELKELVAEYGLTERIVFEGHIPYEEIPLYLSQSDIFVRASRSEGLGNSFIEAMAVGLPVIGTNVGGIPDIIENEKNGLLIPLENRDALVSAIERLREDMVLRSKLGSEGRRTAEKYDWNIISERMQEVFKKVTHL